MFDYIVTTFNVLAGLVTEKRLMAIAAIGIALFLVWIVLQLVFSFQRKFNENCVKMYNFLKNNTNYTECTQYIDENASRISQGFSRGWKKYKKSPSSCPSDFITRENALDKEIESGFLNNGKSIMKSYIWFVTVLIFIFNLNLLGTQSNAVIQTLAVSLVFPAIVYIVLKVFYYAYNNIRQQIYKADVDALYELLDLLDEKFQKKNISTILAEHVETTQYDTAENYETKSEPQDLTAEDIDFNLAEESAPAIEQTSDVRLDDNQPEEDLSEEPEEDGGEENEAEELLSTENADANLPDTEEETEPSETESTETESTETESTETETTATEEIENAETEEVETATTEEVENAETDAEATAKSADEYDIFKKKNIDVEKIINEIPAGSKSNSPFINVNSEYVINDEYAEEETSPKAKEEEVSETQEEQTSDTNSEMVPDSAESLNENLLKNSLSSEKAQEEKLSEIEDGETSTVYGGHAITKTVHKSKLASGGVEIEKNEYHKKSRAREDGSGKPNVDIKTLNTNDSTETIVKSFKNSASNFENNAQINPETSEKGQENNAASTDLGQDVPNYFEENTSNFKEFEKPDLNKNYFEVPEKAGSEKAKKKGRKKTSKNNKKGDKAVETLQTKKTRGRPRNEVNVNSLEITNDKQFNDVLARAEKLMRKSEEGLSQSQSKRIENELKALIEAMNKYKENKS